MKIKYIGSEFLVLLSNKLFSFLCIFQLTSAICYEQLFYESKEDSIRKGVEGRNPLLEEDVRELKDEVCILLDFAKNIVSPCAVFILICLSRLICVISEHFDILFVG